MDIDIQIKWDGKGYKSFLKNLERFVSMFSTIGMHTAEGRKVIKRGRSSTFTVAKLVYQNEFGTTLYVRTKYRKAYGTSGFKARSRKHQGWFVRDRQGNFVAYFPAGSRVTIPKRPFIRATLNNPDSKTSTDIMRYVTDCVINRSTTPKRAWQLMGFTVELDILGKIAKASPPNHWITARAKGFNKPLFDTNNSIANSIKSHVWTNSSKMSAGEKLDRATGKIVNKIYKSSLNLFGDNNKTFNWNAGNKPDFL